MGLFVSLVYSLYGHQTTIAKHRGAECEGRGRKSLGDQCVSCRLDHAGYICNCLRSPFYLTRDEMQAVLLSVRAGLKPGGVILFNLTGEKDSWVLDGKTTNF